MNDRPDLAVLARADGVHIGQDELSVHDARQIVGPDQLIGISTHNIEQARQAVLAGANYIGCGPTFPSSTKHFDHFPGLDFLREVAAEISLPAFAIGGVTLGNLPSVRASGFHRVAVSSALTNSGPTDRAAHQWLTALTTLN
jgi:thiamine-phosphate pyrophosphorylase